MRDKIMNFSYLIAVVGAVVFTWIIHELAHWSTSEYLGYETMMRLNGTSAMEGENLTDWHKVIISAAGPLVTILQAVIVFMVLKNRAWNKFIYPFLFTAFYMRVLAGLMNFINPNDEGRIGAFLDLGIFSLPLIVTALLFFMVYKISNRFNLNWRFHLGTTLLVMIVSSILILSDQYFEVRII